MEVGRLIACEVGCGGAPWVIHRSRPAHVHVNEAALMVTTCLQDSKWEGFLIPVPLTIRAT